MPTECGGGLLDHHGAFYDLVALTVVLCGPPRWRNWVPWKIKELLKVTLEQTQSMAEPGLRPGSADLHVS